MVDTPVLRAISLYFFLTIPDEKRAHSASLLAVSQIRRLPMPNDRIALIGVLHCLRSKTTKLKASLKASQWPFRKDEKSWVIPPTLDLQAWRSFVARADQSECEAVLFSRVLGFTDAEIAVGLGVTDGTVRYRVGRGLRVLGGLAGI